MQTSAEPLASTETSTLSSDGVKCTASMCSAFTCSSQTVCQMPVTAVYQMPFGSSTCLPRGASPRSVSSVTMTTISFSPSRA